MIFSPHKCIHELFEHQAIKHPNKIALVFEEESVSYKDLDAKANQLGHYLQAQGVGPETLVAICVERSLEMIIGILGILKAGAAYVPMDPKYPMERLSFMMEDTKAPVLLTQQKLLSQIPKSYHSNILCLDSDWPKIAQQPTSTVKSATRPNHLIYTIYTSGSTGQPKGVQIEHQNVVNLIEGQMRFVQHPVKRFLYAYSFAFDGAVLLIYWTLLQGATLVIAAEDTEKDVQQLGAFIQKQNISHLLTFPSVYTLLLEQVATEQLQSLESVSVAGEACPGTLVVRHHRLLPKVVLLNQYGPTEATVGATIYKTPSDFDQMKVPIGRPIDQVKIYILDENLKECVIGQTGEIYISGKGIARDYLNQPALSAERFVPNPFDPNPPYNRLYRTGDLASFLPDGNIDFIGRVDHQVKLRGYRIELGEVEAVLLQHPDIREGIVDVFGESASEKRLVAYLVLKEGTRPTITTIREFLAKQLPDYMLPANFVFLDKMPLAASGKIDRKALPAPSRQRPELDQAYVPAKDDLQKYLVAQWCQILQIDEIGIHDRFFELGGNSLQAAQFINELQEQLGETVFIVSIFDSPTIADYTRMLKRDYANALHHIGIGKNGVKNKAIKKSITAKDFDNFSKYVPPIAEAASNPKSKNKRAIFILAPPRSGTSLLRVMLAGHPNLFAANELQLLGFYRMKERAEAYQGKFSLWLEGLVRAIMELQQCDADQAKAMVQDFEAQDWTTQQMYQQVQEWIGERLLVDKSPSYLTDPAVLRKAEQEFDQPFYIHLIRHPYSMIRSFEKMHMDQVMYLKKHPYTAQQIGELIWTCSHQYALDFLQEIPADRQIRIRYEDLVQAPEKVMRDLCQQLNIDYHPDLIRPYKNIDQKMTDGLYADSKPMGDVRLLQHQQIDPKLADRWKGVLQDNFLNEKTWSIARQMKYPDLEESKASPADKSTRPKSGDIAIVGMSARFAGAANINEFWQNLLDEKEVSKVFSDEELLAAGISPEEFKAPDYVRRGMPLEDHDCFDAAFFGYTPREAALMDPQHRLYLEMAYTALEDAGYDPDRFEGLIGVMGGVARNTYLVNNVLTHPNYFDSIEDFTKGITQEKDFPATRVAYKLNLKGPAINIQTACSSSGVAVHLACQSLRNGDSDMMLVGGGRVQPPVDSGHIHTDGHALSPDGYCRAFDADADGMLRGNGMAFIVLRRLDEALQNGDQIYAVIKGAAINNDGSDKIGYTAPSVSGQARAITKAYQQTGIDPATINYIEAHGTGTRIGDPIEVAALSKAFRHFTDKEQYCGIGSVKTNIGHLDAGACIAGIIKTTLALKHGILPANLHFKKPNPQIDFEQSPFYVSQKKQVWERGKQPRRAGVSSLGLGGTNAHIILEEAPIAVQEEIPDKSHQLLLLSAKTKEGLDQMTANLGHHLANYPALEIGTVASTLQLGRKHFSQRRILVTSSLNEATPILQEADPARLLTQEIRPEAHQVVFMFPGGGAQHVNMAKGLYQQEDVFRAAVDQCLNILKEAHQLDLYPILYPEDDLEESKPIEDALHAITLLFTIEYAMARLWESWGVVPSELIGHSLGEYTAACIAGVMSLEDSLALVTRRGRLFGTLPKGAMLSVPLPESEIKPLIGADLSFAAINKPDHCVLSGSVAAIDQMKQEFNRREIHSTRLHISVAAHSQMVEAILPDFEAFLKTIDFHPPRIPIISNLNGQWADEEAIQQPAYWLNHLRQTVRFSDGLHTLLQLEDRILLEVGPGQTLSTFARQHPAKANKQIILASLRHPKEKMPDLAFLLKSIGQLWLSGFPIDWKVFNGPNIQRISLPGYPFVRKRHWIDPKAKQSITAATVNSPLREPLLTTALDYSNMNREVPSRKALLIEKLKEIFHHLSGIPQAEMNEHASFLELGFDSLFLTQATTKIKKELGLKLNFRQLFEEAPTLNALADYADHQLPATAFKEELQEQIKAVQQLPNSPIVSSVPTSPNPLPVFSGEAQPGLEGIIQRQLQLMEQQLHLLSGGGVKTERTKQEADKKGLVKTYTKKLTDQAAADGHGPWKPINQKKDDGLTEQERKYLNELIQRYNEQTKGSKQLAQEQRRHLADPRSITGFNRLWKEMVYQIASKRSKGAKIWDVDGNEYVDFRMAFGISLFGHSPDFIQEAVAAQLEKGFELGVNTPLANKVAQLLCELSGMDRITLVNTGSEAISAALRAARTATGKDKIAVFEGDYHGIADEMLVRAVKRNGRSVSMPVSPGIPQFLVENVIVLDYDDPNVLDVIKANADDLAGVIIEPIQPNRPEHQPRELIHQIRALTKEENIALIFDEMITGFRIAMRGAQEWYDVEADLVAYGKIISGGLPMAALAGRGQFMDCFDGGQWQYGDDSYPEAGVTFYGGTFVKHPLCLAAAYAALSEIKKRGAAIYEELNTKTAHFAERLKTLFIRTKVPLRIKSSASILAIQITDKNPLSRLFFYYVRLKGVHLKEKAGLMSLAHTDADLDFTYQVIEESIREMQTAGFFKITLAEAEDQNLIVYPPQLSKNTNGFLSKSSGKTNGPRLRGTSASRKVKEKKNYPLTEGQKEVWVEQQLGMEAAAAYNLSSDIRLSGPLDPTQLRKALLLLCDRHEALRTYYDPAETIQHVEAGIKPEIPYLDLAELSEEQRKQELETLRQAEISIPFDLFTGPLFRARIIKTKEAEHHLLMTVHHGIADGWSFGVLARDLSLLYTALLNGQKTALPECLQLSDYAQEQDNYRNSEESQKAEKYWLSQFEDGVPVLEFPTDRSRPASKTYSAALEKIDIDQEQLDQLRQLSAKQGTTLFVSLYAAFQVFIQRLSGQDDFVVGMVAAGQAGSAYENTVMHGVSLLPVRMQVDAQQSFTDHLKAAREKVLDAFDHQHYTLGSLVKKLKLARDPSRQPIISILFNMDSAMSELTFGDLDVELEAIPRNFETFDLFVNIKPIDSGMAIEWTFNTDLFNRSTIQRRLREFETLLNSIIANPNELLGRLPLLRAEEKHQLLVTWNDTATNFPDNVCIHELFEQQVSKASEAPAVASADRELTYQELNEQANRLAHLLHERGVRTGDFVGIFLERSVELLVGLLAVLKAGGIYVPLDPANPKERLRVIMEDAEARWLITQERLMSQLPEGEQEVLCLERLGEELARQPILNGVAKVSSQNMAYVIYTSGSTGRPKGILIPHYAVIDHHLAMIDAVDIKASDRMLGVASISFDPSVQDFFLPLFIGGSVVIATHEEVVDGFLLKERMEQSDINFMQATPSTWRMLLMAGWEGHPDLLTMSIGEALNKELANQLLARGRSLWNAYGPSETTIYSTVRRLEGDRMATITESSYEPVGRPLNNVRIYILDAFMEPVPIGVPGELYIGGVGVAPGAYFKRPELSAEKFVGDPFSTEVDAVLYRTGDLARYLPDGDIDFLGRVDHQVKVRGFRIELGEIESLIAQFEGIQENVVVVREDKKDDKRLVAYVVMQAGHELDAGMLRAYLKEHLPEYMLPSAFVEMKAFPLTASLKIDRRRLPAPEYGRDDLETGFIAPASKTEQTLSQLWSQLLSVEPIGVHDNFFELGGHSLIAVNMMSKVKNLTGKKLPLASLLENPTIRTLAQELDREGEGAERKYSSLVPIKASGEKWPVYLVHGAGLHILMYQTFGQYMDPDQPIYGLQARGLNGEEQPLDRIEDIAAHYLSEILDHNPYGPYALAGYSFGGLIAFEMAKQLKAAGKEVLMLGVFDTVVRPHITGQRNTYYQQLANLGKKVAWNISLLAKDPLNNLRYKTNTLQRRYKRWRWRLTHNEEQELAKGTQNQEALVDRMNQLAFDNYKIQAYDGVIHLFRAQERRFFVEDFEYLGWKPFAKGGVRIHEVPGDHLHLFNPPNGAAFAQILQDCLDEVSAVSCQQPLRDG